MVYCLNAVKVNTGRVVVAGRGGAASNLSSEGAKMLGLAVCHQQLICF